ncbi:hypothetical protein CEXT_511891 [Caerostris extrusa]|uniref:Uncharacterized protein n=1 Tax=Caerostris extrusa TaxID=172846 RepID=A0AAV4NPE8_CAEEX|nr:hypothetical protein CEXT_511891 [Caerostris extrusa]
MDLGPIEAAAAASFVGTCCVGHLEMCFCLFAFKGHFIKIKDGMEKGNDLRVFKAVFSTDTVPNFPNKNIVFIFFGNSSFFFAKTKHTVFRYSLLIPRNYRWNQIQIYPSCISGKKLLNFICKQKYFHPNGG